MTVTDKEAVIGKIIIDITASTFSLSYSNNMDVLEVLTILSASIESLSEQIEKTMPNTLVH